MFLIPVAKWWSETAWPWLKAHWQWILFPVGIAMIVAEALSRVQRAGPVVADPTASADARAAAEKASRDAAVATEQAKTAARLEEVREAHRATLQKLTETQMAHATELEEDPEALNAFLHSI